MNHPHLAPGQDVIYVDADKKTHKAKITYVFNRDTADLEFDGKHSAVAPFNDEKEPGTFHFPPEEGGAAVAAGLSPSPTKPAVAKASAPAGT